MANSILYGDEEYFVVLAPDAPEEIVEVSELRQKLDAALSNLSTDDLPLDLQQLDGDRPAQIKSLIETACELEIAPGERLQWYAVRLEK